MKQVIGGENILVSVVIPCRNEAANIESCLLSILAWPDPEESIEVLVVDGRSTDRTREIVEAIGFSDSRLMLIDNPKQSSAAALNIGCSVARGRWILRADAHSEYPLDYLQTCLATAASTGADNVGGVCVSALRKETISAQLVRAATTHWFGVGDAAFRTNGRTGWVDTVPFGFYPREVIEAIGVWDERLSKGSADYEFNQRLLHFGGRIWLNPEIRLQYYNQQKILPFLRRVFTRDGPANVLMWRVAPYAFRLRHSAPLALLLTWFFLLGISVRASEARFLAAGWACSYAVSAVFAAVIQARQHRKWWMTVLLPAVFCLHHLVYALGTAYGILRLFIDGGAKLSRVPYSPGLLKASGLNQPISGLLSIVIPCRNEASFIERCLRSALSMKTDGYSIEIIVIDGHSTDATTTIVEDLARSDPRIQLLQNPLGATAPALNLGLRRASGEWVIRLDAHAWYEKDYIQECLRVATRTGAAAVGGVCIVELATQSLGAKLVRAVTTHRFGVGRSIFRTGMNEASADTVLFGCYRREVFDKVGIWDERLAAGNEDFEINQRVINAGQALWFSPTIRAHYFNKARVSAFFAKALERDGACNPWMWYLWPSAFRVRHAIPMFFAAALAMLTLLAAWSAAPLCVVLLAYFLAAVAASAQQAFRYREWRVAILAPFVFFGYHMAHGVGAWYGLLLLLAGRAPVSSKNVRRLLSPVPIRQSRRGNTRRPNEMARV